MPLGGPACARNCGFSTLPPCAINRASNAENYPTKVETIRRLSGSRTARLYHFRANLIKALGDLQKEGAITSWTIDPKTDNVSFERTPSASQQRHLIRKLAKPRKTP